MLSAGIHLLKKAARQVAKEKSPGLWNLYLQNLSSF